MAQLEARLREDMKHLAERVGRLEHSQAKLEGLLEGLREAITGRVAAGWTGRLRRSWNGL